MLSALNLIKRAPALYYFHSIAPDRFLENATRNWIAKLDANRKVSRGQLPIFLPCPSVVYIFVGHLFLRH